MSTTFDLTKTYTVTLCSDSRDDNYFDKGEFENASGIRLDTNDGDVCYDTFSGDFLNKSPMKVQLLAMMVSSHCMYFKTSKLYVEVHTSSP